MKFGDKVVILRSMSDDTVEVIGEGTYKGHLIDQIPIFKMDTGELTLLTRGFVMFKEDFEKLNVERKQVNMIEEE